MSVITFVILLQAVIEETEIRCNELRKEIYDFNRVLGGEENIRSKKFDADKIIKYFDDTLDTKVGIFKILYFDYVSQQSHSTT